MTNEELIENVAKAIQHSTKVKVDEHYGHPTYLCKKTHKMIEDKTEPKQLLSETYQQIDWSVSQQIAQAVIRHLTPMMREVVKASGALADDFSEYFDDIHGTGEQLHTVFKMRKILASLPECWLQQVQSQT